MVAHPCRGNPPAARSKHPHEAHVQVRAMDSLTMKINGEIVCWGDTRLDFGALQHRSKTSGVAVDLVAEGEHAVGFDVCGQ